MERGDLETYEKNTDKAAKKMRKRASKLNEKAAKKDKKGKPGGDKLRKRADYLDQGASYLESDGSDGAYIHAVDNELYQTIGSTLGAARVPLKGKHVIINLDNNTWDTSNKLAQRSIGHESLHSVGLSDQIGSNGFRAYKYSSKKEHRDSFKELKGTPLADINPDHIIDDVIK